MKALRLSLKQLLDYPTAIIGLSMIASLFFLAIYAVVTIPYSQALEQWRGGEDIVALNPRNARPTWRNWFASEKWNPTILVSSETDDVNATFETLSDDIEEKIMTFTFDYDYDAFPPEMSFFIKAKFEEKAPFVEFTWITPDGREIRAGEVTPNSQETYRPSLDDRVVRRIDDRRAEVGFFLDPNSVEENPVEGAEFTGTPLKGTYTLRVNGLLFEEDADLEVDAVVYGRVHGIAGTDHQRRDLSIALLWGTPIALSFGLVAAIFTTVTTMTIAAVGVWYGGWVDSVIQRVTEVNLILPILPILIMIGTLYSRSIWVILGAVIALSIFGGGVKNFRSIFLQVRELPYIEAAQSYGASSRRVIFRYLIPRVIPLIIPSLVSGVPGFVFLEASLAVLNLGDPVLPTWGKVISDAQSEGALFNGYYYWILEPAGLLMFAGIGFAMVGFALDRIFNPRLREI